MATIAESVKDELVWIGIAKTDGLKAAVHRRVGNPEGYLYGAEKAAIACGYRLLVSWAATSQSEAHKAGLVQAYEEQHRQRPGFRHPDTGEWAAGVCLLIRKMEISDHDLTWSPWMPMDETFISTIPEEHGVYRVCAVPPQKRVPVVEMSDHSQDWLHRGREARFRHLFLQRFGREPTPEEIKEAINPPLERFLTKC